jgi:hypothetical protein
MLGSLHGDYVTQFILLVRAAPEKGAFMASVPRGDSPSLSLQVLVQVANATYMATTGVIGDRYAVDYSNQVLGDPQVFDFLEDKSISAADLAKELDLA